MYFEVFVLAPVMMCFEVFVLAPVMCFEVFVLAICVLKCLY